MHLVSIDSQKSSILSRRPDTLFENSLFISVEFKYTDIKSINIQLTRHTA